MRILGYLLLVFNLAAGAGYLYLAVQDWGKRQAIQAAGLTQYVRIQGVPVDEPAAADKDAIPFPVSMDGLVVETVSPAFLAAYYKGAEGGPQLGAGPTDVVASQVGEVKRVQAKVGQLIDGADGEAAKARLIHGFLQYGVRNYDERTRLLAMRDAMPPDVQGLRDRLDAAFNRALTRQPVSLAAVTAAADGEKLDAAGKARAASGDDAERAGEIAHLLVHLDATSADWQKRVAAVVGARAYVRAVSAQGGRWQAMAGQVSLDTLRDQEIYSVQYEQLRNLARDRTEQVRSSRDVRTGVEAQLQRDKDFVAQRKKHLEEVNARFADTQKEIARALAEQTDAEGRLFKVQREVGVTLDDIFRLESELAAREQALAAAAGKK